METTTQPQRKMLRRICTLGWIGGLVMIASGTFGVGVLAFQGHVILGLIGVRGVVREGVDAIEGILMGVVILAVVDFIRYAIEEGAEPRWILRKGHIILSLFALCLLVTMACGIGRRCPVA